MMNFRRLSMWGLSQTVFSLFRLTCAYANPTITYPASSFQLYADQDVVIVPVLAGFTTGQKPNCSAVSLPFNLTINPVNCAISGTLPSFFPTALPIFNSLISSPALTKTIEIAFQISNRGVVYSASTFQLFANQQVFMVPKLVGFQTGETANCKASILPPGLAINANTCIISGQLPPSLPPQGITISGNVTSSASPQPIVLNFNLSNQGIVFAQNSYPLFANQQVIITPQLLGLQSGEGVNCSASSLPQGLSINPNTCVISGVLPQFVPEGVSFNVSVSSSLMPQPIGLTFQLSNQGVVYPASSFHYLANQFVLIVPQLLGFQPGEAVNCSASLPLGMAIDPNTCVLSGQLPASFPTQGLNASFTVTSAALSKGISLSFQFTNN